MNTSRQQLLTTRALAILVCVSACDEGSDPAPDEATNTLAASDLALGDDAAPDALDSAGMDVADLQDQFAFDADPGFVQDLYGDPVPSNITTPVPELAGAGEIDLALTDVVEPYYPSARELDHILELRLNYGLSANAEFVRELHAEPRRHGAIRSRVSLFGGLLLAPNELDQAKMRVRVENVGHHASAWASEAFGSQFAGAFLEGSSVILLCAGCDDEVVARLPAAEQQFPRALKGRVEIRPVAHPLSYLADVEARLSAFLSEYALSSNGTTVDVIGNDVDLRVGPSSVVAMRESLPRLQEAVGGPIELVVDDIDVEPTVNKNTKVAYALVEGGQAIGVQPGVNICTSGFAVGSGFGPFIMTAGHCALSLNQTWYQGGAVLGKAAARNLGGNSDAALISTYGYRNNWGRVHATSTDWNHPVTFGCNAGHNLVNQTVCQVGISTTCNSGNCNIYNRCGLVTSHSYRPPSNLGEYPFNAVFGWANYLVNHGDSGAAVYWPTGFGYGAAGIVDGGYAGGFGSYFTRYSVIASQWGLSVSPY